MRPLSFVPGSISILHVALAINLIIFPLACIDGTGGKGNRGLDVSLGGMNEVVDARVEGGVMGGELEVIIGVFEESEIRKGGLIFFEEVGSKFIPWFFLID